MRLRKLCSTQFITKFQRENIVISKHEEFNVFWRLLSGVATRELSWIIDFDAE